ncbi:peptidase inhibitor family I36 protein [Promicromonospora xylanilytica]
MNYIVKRVRVLGSTLVALLLILGGGLAAAPTASAADPCPSTYACSYENTNYHNGGGSWVRFWQAVSRYDDFGMGDKASSTYNNGTNCKVRFYQHEYHTGNSLTIRPGGYGYGNLSNVKMGSTGLSWNDRISSGQFLSDCPGT